MRHSQKGVALMSVLVVVVLISTLAYQLYAHQALATAQTRIGLEATRHRELLLSAENVAIAILSEDLIDEETRLIDHASEAWGTIREPLSLPYGNVYMQIHDATGRVNLNAIAVSNEPSALKVFRRLLEELGESNELAAYWRDWVDADDARFLVQGYHGREDLDWLVNDPPFRTANQLAADLTELRIVAPLPTQSYDALSSFVTVLPTTTHKININTTSAAVMNALVVVQQANVRPVSIGAAYETVEEFIDRYPNYAEIQDQLSVVSEYFDVEAVVQGPDARMGMTSRLVRDLSSGTVRVYARSFGKKHAWFNGRSAS